MLSRIVATWLIALIVSPFTAPFATCDLSTIFGAAPVPRSLAFPFHASKSPISGSHAVTTTARARRLSPLDALVPSRPDHDPISTPAPIAHVAVPGSPAMAVAGRIRKLPFRNIFTLAAAAVPSPAVFWQSIAAARQLQNDAALTTVLRV